MTKTQTSKDIKEEWANKHVAHWTKGTYVDVEKLYPIAATKEIKEMDILCFSASKSRASGFSRKRYNKADTSYPILYYSDPEYNDYVIIDGRHRFHKQKDSGQETIKAIELTIQEIESCIIGEEYEIKNSR